MRSQEKTITSSLVFRYRFALGLLAVLSLASFLILEENTRSEKSAAAIVNYSGRQRMLSQRIALFSTRLIAAKDTLAQENLRRELKAIIELMEKSHQGLTGGERSMNLPARQSQAVRELYFSAPILLDAQVRKYLQEAWALASASSDTLTPENPHMQYILEASGERLIKSLDMAVARHQKESEGRIRQLETLQFLVLIITLCVLYITGLFIFHPLARRIQLKTEQLEKQTAALLASNERLQKEIGESAELENKLIAANELNDTLLKTIPFGIDIVDGEGNILYLNDKMKNIFGQEALGKKCYHLYKDDKKQCESCPLKNGVYLGRTRGIEISGVMGGKTFLISHTGMFYQNKKATLEIFEDITDYKKTQEKLAASQRLADIGRMAGVIAHEFRNQLGVIRNAVYFLKMKIEDKDEKVRRHLGILDEQVTDAERIIQDILTFARTKHPELQKIDLKNILLASIEKVRIPESIALTTKIEQLPLFDADPLQIDGVFVNIILNALQAMREKGELRISLQKEGNYAAIIFKDTGPGIKEEDRMRLFEPFFSTKARGTGLGLANAKNVVEGHAGTIAVESDYGKGTRVTVRLPLKSMPANGAL